MQWRLLLPAARCVLDSTGDFPQAAAHTAAFLFVRFGGEVMTAEIPCVVGPADLWFSDVPEEIDHARNACGVWGGELFLGGLPVPSPKRNGRPRKDAAHVEALAHERMTQRIGEVLASA
jgi:WhiB family transcriptional regulator, redox-sensing transcriptional regulator